MSKVVTHSYPVYNSTQLSRGLEVGSRDAEKDVRTIAPRSHDKDPHNAMKTSNAEVHAGPNGSTFQQSAIAHIDSVRRTLRTMLESKGKQILKTRDVQKHFGVDSSFSWQLFKLFNAEDLLGSVPYIPPAVSVQKIIRAAREQGIDEPFIDEALAAFDAFEAFAIDHAGDRTRFELMASAMGNSEDARQAAEQQRKSLFKAHTFLWGLELGTIYMPNLLGPSKDNPRIYDGLHLINQLELSRLRPDADNCVAALYVDREAGRIMREPLDPEAAKKHGAAILPQFSTKALPHLRTETDEHGLASTFLTDDSIGVRSNMDLAFGEIVRNVWTTGSGQFTANGQTTITKPTRRMYMEFLIHRSLTLALHPSVKVFGHVSMNAQPFTTQQRVWTLPCLEKATLLKPKEDPRLEDVPRRHELLTYACEKMGWSLPDFDTYRLRIDYPVLDTATVLSLNV